MTRGQIAIILPNNEVMTSIEFNGDMYLTGHGYDVIEILRGVENRADYQLAVAKFNKENHNYCDCDTLTYLFDGESAKAMLDFNKDYFDRWFSDYVYIKNLSKEPVKLNTRDTKDNDKPMVIEPNDILVLCFGRAVLHVIGDDED